MKKLILTFCLIFSCQNSFAVVGVPDSTHWVSAWFGGAGRYSMILPDNFVPNKWYAVSDVGTPLVSTDAGENWTWLAYSSTNGFDGPQPTALVQSKSDANLMYLISGNTFSTTAGRLIKSTTGGTTWTKLTNNKASRTSSGKVLAIDPTNDNIAFAALDNGTVIRTTDGGATWPVLFTPFGANQKATWLYVNPTGTKVWVGGPNRGLKVYTIATDTLTTITLTGTLAIYSDDYDTYIDGSSVENLCVATGVKIACTADTDAGSSWTYTSAVTATANMYIGRFAVSRNSDGSLNFMTWSRLTTNSQGGSLERYSTNSGTTWTAPVITYDHAMNPFSMTYVGQRSMASIANDPNDSSIFIFSTDGAILKSADFGAHFYEKDRGAANTVTSDMDIAPDGSIFACSMDAGCQKTNDYGATWKQVVPTSNGNGGHYWRVLTMGTAANWLAGTGIVIVTATRYLIPTKPYWNVVARSTDNGNTFTFIETGLPTAPFFGDTVWDRGYARGLAKGPDDQTLYLSIDGATCQANPALPQNCTTNYANGGIFRSLDRGLTWSRASSSGSQAKVYNGVAVDPSDATGKTMMYATFGYNTYRTTTGITPYSYVNSTNYAFEIRYDSSGHPYEAGNASGPVIYKSIVTPYGNANGAYGTWILMKRLLPASVTGGNADGLEIDPINNNRVFASIVGLSVMSANNGNRVFVTPDAQNGASSTWYDISGDLPAMGGCQDLEVNYNEGTQGFLYCATNGNGVFKLDLADSPTLTTGVTKIGTN